MTAWIHYDALGRRVLVEHDPNVGSTEAWTFQYDDQGLVRAVYDESEALVASYVTGFGFGEVLAEVRGSTVRYALRDKLGTAVAWLDDAGEVDEEVLRDSYGVRVAGTTEPVAYGYTGHAEDPTGLVWGRARYLDVETGTWLSEDPVSTEWRYAYSDAAPTWAVDLDGLTTSTESTVAKRQRGCNTWNIFGKHTGQIWQSADGKKYVENLLDKSWWSPNAPGGHGSPAGGGGVLYKVYEKKGNVLEHKMEANEFGDRIDKHKGPKGKEVRFKNLCRIK